MRIKRLIFNATSVVFLTSISTLLHGCGGSGSTKPETFYPLASQTRLFQPGDTWIYDTNERTTIAAATLDGKPVLTRVDGGGDGSGGGGYGVAYLSQDENGEVVYIGKKGIDHTVLLPDDPAREVQLLPAPQPILFGTWAVGKSVSFKLLYDNYGAVRPDEGNYATLTIVGTEKVKTPLGTFDTWKVEGKPDGDTNYAQISGTYWYAPQLGVFVRSHELIDGADGETYGTFDKTLKSTNIPLGIPQAAP